MVGVVGWLAVAGATAGAQAATQAVADARYTGGEIYFEPRVGASQWSLTVTGPNDLVLERRNAGTPPSISVFDDNGQPLPDGSYSYRLQPETSLSPSLFQEASPETSDGRGYALRSGTVVPELPALSGHFRILGGSIVTPQGVEPQSTSQGGTRTLPRSATTSPAASAPGPSLQTIAQDVSIQGSLCVGVDCTTSESFGFDTIRLKENNLRLKVEDTSTSAGFPTTDWQLTFNDSASGGADKFSIEDITDAKIPFTIEGNAPTDSLHVTSAGRVGIGTGAPALHLQVTDGNTPGLRLEQNGSSGFTPQTWDVAGNEANFFVRDTTNGSTYPLRIEPGAPNDSVSIKSTGRVGFGDRYPDAPLHVQTNGSNIGVGNAAIKLVNTAGPVALQFDPSDNGVFWNFGVPSDNLFRVSRSGTGAAELELNSAGDLTLRGGLTIGGTCTGCDGLFAPDYPLESLEQHAAFMWQHSFLPDVGPTPDGRTQMHVFQKTSGMLKELEKAHIYIAQLDKSLKEKDAELADLRARVARIEALLSHK